MKLRAFFAVLAFLLLNTAFHLHAQSISTPNRVEIIIETTDSDYTELIPGTANPFAGDSVKLSLTLELEETTGIENIHVKVGSTSGSGDYIDKTFTFDVTGSLGDGTSYVRSGNTVYLRLGMFFDIEDVFAEVFLEDSLGAFTTAVTTSYITD